MSRIEAVLQRLRKEFTEEKKLIFDPKKALEEALRLKSLFWADRQGLFLTQARKIFVDDYPLDPKLKSKKDIDLNSLAGLVLVLSYPDFFLDEKHQKTTQYSLSLLQETLEGKNTDFLEGKKESSLITPLYVLLRSLEEKTSYWLISAFKKMPYKERKKIREKIEEIIERLSKIIPEEKRDIFLRKFMIDLDWLYKEPPKPITKISIKNEKTLEEDLPLKKDEKESFFDEKDKELLFSAKKLMSVFYLDNDGFLKTKKEEREKREKYIRSLSLDDPNFQKLAEKLGRKNLPYFSLLYSLSPFHLADLSNNEIRSALSFFKKGLNYVFSSDGFSQLQNILTNDYRFIDNPQKFNQALKDFLGIKSEKLGKIIVPALRKIFYFRLINNFYDGYENSTNAVDLDSNLKQLFAPLQQSFSQKDKISFFDEKIFSLSEEKLISIAVGLGLVKYGDIISSQIKVEGKDIVIESLDRNNKDYDSSIIPVKINGEDFFFFQGIPVKVKFVQISNSLRVIIKVKGFDTDCASVFLNFN